MTLHPFLTLFLVIKVSLFILFFIPSVEEEETEEEAVEEEEEVFQFVTKTV